MRNNKMNNSMNIIAVLCVIGMFFIAFAAILDKDEIENDEGGLAVSGSAELEVDPDEAIVYISINTLKENAKLAQDENAGITDDVKKALENVGIKEDLIETNSYNLYEKKEWDYKTEESKSVGYQLSHTLKVVVKDVTKVGDVVDASVEAGANGVDTVSFTLSKERQMELKEQVLQKAIAAAEKKAKNIAETLSIEVGDIVSVSEQNYYPVYETANFRNVVAYDSVGGSSISPQKVQLTGQINLVYDIE